MVDMNMTIAGNILALLKKQNKKQTDLAEALNTNRQTVNKMLNGSRMINAIELKQIAGRRYLRMFRILILFMLLWGKWHQNRREMH